MKFTPLAADVDKFVRHAEQYRGHINPNEREEHFKQPLRTLLTDFYDPTSNHINTQHNQDLAIYLGPTANSRIGVMFETKKPASSEMIKKERPNVKALWELVLYYFEERLKRGNFELKYLVATDYLEFYVFDANQFHRHFFQNSEIKRLYETKVNDGKPNTDFYPTLEGLIDKYHDELPCVHFSLDKPEKLNKTDRTAIFKMLSPRILLKQKSIVDRNALNRSFYDELLHIIGLTEKKEGKKITIVRPDADKRNSASLLELAISKLEIKYPCNFTQDELLGYGQGKDEQIFSIAFELCLTWINRILFLKLLEAQIIKFHPDEKGFSFLNIEKTGKFNKLFNLFHFVLAVKPSERDQNYTAPFENVPYLNSSLFDISEIERKAIDTTSLDDSQILPYYKSTVLKQQSRDGKNLDTLSYLFDFLAAFDYTSVTQAQLEVSDDRLINASLLGKIFEKINGYRDGSIYTPGFVTMYMCREAIRPAAINKFNEVYGWDIESFDGLRNKLGRYSEPHKLLEFSSVVDSLRICDPAVGSGHFLVSALNELIAIKFELGILCDESGHSFGNVEIRIEDDELIITDDRNEAFHYEVRNGRPSKEVQRLQKTLFHQKQTIIENCLFGVDINPNSVAICRLRLWIELLKHSYYKEESNFTELETLPNIDINIKRGNSLLSRFDLRDSFVSKHAVEVLLKYADDVRAYREETDKESKQSLQRSIDKHQKWLSNQLIDETIEIKQKINKKLAILAENQNVLFHQRTIEEKEDKIKLIERDLVKLNAELALINRKYDDAFEWRFEFPEVLDKAGNFSGFDVIIGNPPYLRISKIPNARHLRPKYKTYHSSGDILCLFYEKAPQLLKQNGLAFLITSNKWMRSDYGMATRDFLANETTLLFLFDFDWYQVFDNASVDSNLLLMAPNATQGKLEGCVADRSFKIENLSGFISNNRRKLYFPDPTFWAIVSDETNNLKRKLIDAGKPISEWSIDINRGILTGLNEAFVISGKTRKRLVELDSRNADVIRPFFRGQDVHRYGIRLDDIWLINSHNGLKEFDIPRIEIQKDYPTIYQYLVTYQTRAEERADKGDHWTNLRNCAYLNKLDSPKLVWAETMRVHKEDRLNFPRFGFDDGGFIPDKTVFFAVGDDIKFLLGVLNSDLGRFLVKTFVDKLDSGGYMMQKSSIEKVPIMSDDEQLKSSISSLVDLILNEASESQIVSDAERQINRLLFEAYDFSNAEQELIANT